jgi:pimeloyl-ACP methyl ester carboxylesterase
MKALQRGFIAVGQRRVHYRRAGHGPPVVLLHGSPGDSEMLGAEMAALAETHCCIALDTAGFGFSDALPGEVLSVPDLAGATAAAMAALGLPPCPVYGTHTGAAIALELGLGWPQQVSGLVLEGLPIFSQAEIDALFGDYFAPMVPDPLGGHLFATWMRFRDQFTWFPWTSRSVARLNPVDRPRPADIHHWVAMYYRSCKTYRPAYRAACHYGPLAVDAVRRLQLPAVFMASAEDMLHPHLDRLPPLRAGQHIERLAHDEAAKHRAIAGFVAGLPAASSDAFEPPSQSAGHDPAWRFIDSGAGQVLLRSFGRPDSPALMLLHDAPGSGQALLAMARALADDFHVLLPDLPGNGESTPPAEGDSALAAGAAALQAIASELGLKRYAVAGFGCGAAVAARLVQHRDPRLGELLLIAPPEPDEATALAIAPPLPLSADGAHWMRAWMMLRDGQIYAPWFDGRIAAQRRTQGCFDAQWLHDQTCALMAARASYHRLPQEAWRSDSVATLARAELPVHVVPSPQPGAAELSEAEILGLIRSHLSPDRTSSKPDRTLTEPRYGRTES